MKRHQRLIRAKGFILAANDACVEAMALMGNAGEGLSPETCSLILAQLYTVEVQAKMAKELVADSMKQSLLDEADQP